LTPIFNASANSFGFASDRALVKGSARMQMDRVSIRGFPFSIASSP
jgi:hypothetical protein